MNTKVLRVTNNLFDLFWGDGWYNHARFKWDNASKSFILISKEGKLPNGFIDALNKAKVTRV